MQLRLPRTPSKRRPPVSHTDARQQEVLWRETLSGDTVIANPHPFQQTAFTTLRSPHRRHKEVRAVLIRSCGCSCCHFSCYSCHFSCYSCHFSCYSCHFSCYSCHFSCYFCHCGSRIFLHDLTSRDGVHRRPRRRVCGGLALPWPARTRPCGAAPPRARRHRLGRAPPPSGALR